MQMVTFNNNDNNIIDNKSSFKLDISSMIGKEIVFDYGVNTNTSKKDTQEKPKKKRININGTEVVSREDDLPAIATNAPYKDSYYETDAVLKNSINNLNMISNDLMQDIQSVRASRTLKNKYNYLSNMYSGYGSLSSGIVAAARELNNSIKTAHELEFKRTKEFKLNDQVDDTKAIMDTYNAFVNMPVNTGMMNGYNSPLGPTTADLTLNSANLLSSAIGANPDVGYQNYLNNMTPEQAMMMYENNPDIKQVVLYDQSTGRKSFEIINSRTGEILQGLPKRNTEMYMPDTVIDPVNKVARNINLDEVYDVIIVGESNGMENY
jgi:hypothetical protein